MGIFELPEGYEELRKIDLQKDKKLAILINGIALIITVVMFILGFFVGPEFEFDFESIATILPYMILVLVLMAVYIVGHELVHGIFFKKYSGAKVKYGFTGMYAYAGSDAFFNKNQYRIIALAPVVFFGVLFLVLNVFLPGNLFWIVYILQITNISGAAGDIYMMFLLNKLPKDILVLDDGVSMTIYSKKQ